MARNCIYTIFSFIFLISCDNINWTASEVSTTGEGEKLDGLVKKFRSNGALLSEANYKNGVLDGIAKNYYPNGKVKTEIVYASGKKEGITTSFYETGEKYKETTYTKDEKNGWTKLYHKNGKLAAEIPFKDNFPGKGLKEYLSSGAEKKVYPELKIEVVDRLSQTGEYTLLVSFTKDHKRGEYYVGDLTGGQYLNDQLFELPTMDGKGVMTFRPPGPGSFIMKKINFVGNLKTPTGNPYILEKTYNLAIEF